MEYKVFIFSDDVIDGQYKFDFVKFNKICVYNLIDVKSINIEKFDLDWLLPENKNLIIFCENKNLDNLIIKNIKYLSGKRTLIDEQLVIFEKENSRVIFAPIESDLDLLNKVFTREGKKFCEFHLFGIGKSQVKDKLEKLKGEIDGFNYKFIYDNLLCDIVLSYNGSSELIDDNQVKIAGEFKQYVYRENEMSLREKVSKMLALKNKTLSICENVTRGAITESLLKSNENFKIKEVKFEEFELTNNDVLYDKTIKFLKSSEADIAVVTHGKRSPDGLEFTFAIADNFEVHIFKNNFKAEINSCLEMAKNALLFHLVKKLRQNDISF